jgi:hypothetical protein
MSTYRSGSATRYVHIYCAYLLYTATRGKPFRPRFLSEFAVILPSQAKDDGETAGHNTASVCVCVYQAFVSSYLGVRGNGTGGGNFVGVWTRQWTPNRSSDVTLIVGDALSLGGRTTQIINPTTKGVAVKKCLVRVAILD